MRNEFGTFGDGEVSCSACDALCCRSNTAIPLTKDEAAQLTAAGSELRLMDRSECGRNRPGRGREFYEQTVDCGNLDQETGLCKDYGSRPRACREFALGEFSCEAMRVQRGFAAVDLGMPAVRTEIAVDPL